MNSPEQVVISGHKGAVERAVALAAEQAQRGRAAAGSAPFHCSLMRPAQERLAQDLGSCRCGNPTPSRDVHVDAAL